MVITIRNTGYLLPLFECAYWSRYPEEQECLFIGSLQIFEFVICVNLILMQIHH